MGESLYKEENISVKRTKQAIKKALLEIVQTKSFKSISVQDITSASGYGRSTFYTHFHDKFDLVEWIMNDEAFNYANTVRNAILENSPVNDDKSMYEACYTIINQQFENRSFYNALIHELIPGYSTAAFAENTYMLLMELFDYASSHWPKELDHKFYFYILTNTLIDQIKYWEKDGYKLTVEEMAAQARALHVMWGYKSVILKDNE